MVKYQGDGEVNEYLDEDNPPMAVQHCCCGL